MPQSPAGVGTQSRKAGGGIRGIYRTGIHFQPFRKIFIAENVKGFYRLKQGYYFDLACKQFESIGYTISHKLINSSDFGVPQKRERIFIVGIVLSILLLLCHGGRYAGCDYLQRYGTEYNL